MLLLLGYTLFPRVQQLGWAAVWPTASGGSATRRWPWLGPLLLAALLVLAAALRLPALDSIPQGIDADEGDRAATALDVLSGQTAGSWFESGWFYINLIYFRLLAGSMLLFGRDIAGARMLSALTGLGFVAAVAWLGHRNFGWRIALFGTALAASMGVTLQYSRFVSEAGPTGLLWALSIGGFLEGARTGRLWAWALAGLTGGLGLYFYPSARLWPVGAALTVLLLFLRLRDRKPQLWLGFGVAAFAAVIAAAPFLVHLSVHREETTTRYLQTTVLDPNNQSRLGYLTPPVALPELLAVQVERTLGMFDRYADGGGFLPTGHPLFGRLLAALTLLGAAYSVLRGRRDTRMAVLSVWFWLGLSAIAVTVETPDFHRAVGILPALCFVIAVPLVDVIDRALGVLSADRPTARRLLGGLIAAALALVLVIPEAGSYFTTFSSVPEHWAPPTREGQLVAALGKSGPVYSIETDEHLVSSGWVRLLAQTAQRGRIPNPGRELPALAAADGSGAPGRLAFIPGDGQGLSLILTGDVNQGTYIDLFRGLYPLTSLADAADGHRTLQVSSDALAATRGVTLVSQDGSARAADTFGQIPADLSMPATLTWRAGIRLPQPGTYRLAATAPGRAQLRLDGIPVADRSIDSGTPLGGDALVAPGLHFLELVADVTRADQRVSLTLGTSDTSPRELDPTETYRLMDAPWGLLGRLTRPSPQTQSLASPSDAFLDATIAMAFFDPEVGPIDVPNSFEWTGSLLVPQSGVYRMAFATEDAMHLQVDNRPVDVVSVGPGAWQSVGFGSQVSLTEGTHRIGITLDVTHGGRELARWNWVPPTPGGALDTTTNWSVVPPQVLRPDPAVVPLAD